MKVVAVSQRVELLPERNERRDALDQRLCAWLIGAGYLPVAVPNAYLAADSAGAPALQAWLERVRPDAVLLSGGNGIGEARERDRTGLHLLAYAQERSLPVLGICHGMQLIGAWAGAMLTPVTGHVATRHALRGGPNADVNSFHHYALSACPAGFTVTAAAPDGCIEAIRHVSLPWEGWMWHPEREAAWQPGDLQRLRHLFGA